jgi:hypothetical protein
VAHQLQHQRLQLRYSFPYTNINTYSYGYSFPYTNINGLAHADAEISAYAKASPDTTAETIGFWRARVL